MREINGKNWVGIEIFNSENKPFTGILSIIDIAELETLHNPLELLVHGDSSVGPVLQPGLWQTLTIAYWEPGDLARIGSDETFIQIRPGEYTILTQLNGSFNHSGIMSEHIRIEPIQRTWILRFKVGEIKLELKSVNTE